MHPVKTVQGEGRVSYGFMVFLRDFALSRPSKDQPAGTCSLARTVSSLRILETPDKKMEPAVGPQETMGNPREVPADQQETPEITTKLEQWRIWELWKREKKLSALACWKNS